MDAQSQGASLPAAQAALQAQAGSPGKQCRSFHLQSKKNILFSSRFPPISVFPLPSWFRPHSSSAEPACWATFQPFDQLPWARAALRIMCITCIAVKRYRKNKRTGCPSHSKSKKKCKQFSCGHGSFRLSHVSFCISTNTRASTRLWKYFMRDVQTAFKLETYSENPIQNVRNKH